MNYLTIDTVIGAVIVLSACVVSVWFFYQRSTAINDEDLHGLDTVYLEPDTLGDMPPVHISLDSSIPLNEALADSLSDAGGLIAVSKSHAEETTRYRMYMYKLLDGMMSIGGPNCAPPLYGISLTPISSAGEDCETITKCAISMPDQVMVYDSPAEALTGKL